MAVPPESATETFAALRLYVNSWRWQGVPCSATRSPVTRSASHQARPRGPVVFTEDVESSC
ncbi:MAG: hypothetical protein QM767_23810 [Anaeromyxobacter sp.]